MMSQKPALRSVPTLPGLGHNRQAPRLDFFARVEVLPMDVRRSRIWGHCDEIGHQGMFIRTTQSPEIDTLLVLKVHVHDASLRLVARVVHRLPGIGFGCEFIDLDDRQLAALSALVSRWSAAPLGARTIH